jgi:hypothetical protein
MAQDAENLARVLAEEDVMEEIQTFVREQVDLATRQCMAGDESVPKDRAIEIAEKAVGLVIAADSVRQEAQSSIPLRSSMYSEDHVVDLLQIACALIGTILQDKTRDIALDEARAFAFETVQLGLEAFGNGTEP